MKLDMTKGVQNLIDETGLTQKQLEEAGNLGSGTLTKAKGNGDIKLCTLSRIADGIDWGLNNLIDALDVESIKYK